MQFIKSVRTCSHILARESWTLRLSSSSIALSQYVDCTLLDSRSSFIYESASCAFHTLLPRFLPASCSYVERPSREKERNAELPVRLLARAAICRLIWELYCEKQRERIMVQMELFVANGEGNQGFQCTAIKYRVDTMMDRWGVRRGAATCIYRVDQIYKVKMADLQGHLQEIMSRSSYVQLLVHDVMYDVIISVDRCWR
jgi:hypothetical protein